MIIILNMILRNRSYLRVELNRCIYIYIYIYIYNKNRKRGYEKPFPLKIINISAGKHLISIYLQTRIMMPIRDIF